MVKLEVEKPTQWLVNSKIFSNKYSNLIKLTVSFQGQSKIFGIFQIIKEILSTKKRPICD